MIFLFFFHQIYLTLPKLYKCVEKIEISQSTAKLITCTKVSKFACMHSNANYFQNGWRYIIFSSHLILWRVYLNIYEK